MNNSTLFHFTSIASDTAFFRLGNLAETVMGIAQRADRLGLETAASELSRAAGLIVRAQAQDGRFRVALLAEAYDTIASACPTLPKPAFEDSHPMVAFS